MVYSSDNGVLKWEASAKTMLAILEESPETIAARQLRMAGLRATAQRVIILRVIGGMTGHPTLEEIYRAVRRRLPTISLNTVYKTLEILCHKGLVTKVNPLHEVARYDGETGRHIHLICRRCHGIADLHRQPEAFPSFTPEELQGFRVENQSHTLWGLCPRCQELETGKER